MCDGENNIKRVQPALSTERGDRSFINWNTDCTQVTQVLSLVSGKGNAQNVLGVYCLDFRMFPSAPCKG